MKREKIYALLKKKGIIRLLSKKYKDMDGNMIKGEQFIGHDSAMYSLRNLPIFNEETICSLVGTDSTHINCEEIDIPDRLKEIIYKNISDLNAVPIEYSCDMFELSVFTNMQHNICVFADPKFIVPLLDNEVNSFFWYDDLIICYDENEVFLKAIIAPYIPTDKKLNQEIELTALVHNTLTNIKMQENK